MKKVFLTNLILQVALNLIVKPLYIFGIDRSVNNIVGASAYGFYFALLNLSFLLLMVNDFGIQNFTSKTIAAEPNKINQYFSNLLIFKLLLSIGYFILTFIVAFSLGYDQTQLKLLFLLTLVQALSSFFLFFRANLAALGFFKTDSFLSVFDRLELLILCSFLLFFNYFDAENGIWIFAIAQVVSMFLACVIGFLFLMQKIDIQHIKFNFTILKKIIKESLPFALIAFLMTFYTRSDAVILERILSDGEMEAGIYASAYRLLDALNSVTLIFGTLLLPMFTRQINAKESVKPLLSLALTLISFIGITAALSIFGFRYEIMQLLYPASTTYWADVLGILILSFVPLSLMYVLGAYSTARNLLKEQHILFAIVAILNITLNFFLILQKKALGAAIATLITQSAVILGFLIINRFDFDWKKIIKMLFFAAFYALFIYFVKKIDCQWYLQMMMSFVAALVISSLLGFWELRKIRKMLFMKSSQIN